ncbi:uncharacterized protein V6R79_011050 [Siganus canaliculatus]
MDCATAVPDLKPWPSGNPVSLRISGPPLALKEVAMVRVNVHADTLALLLSVNLDIAANRGGSEGEILVIIML